jgi:parallel beta-helix repeat protein
VGIGSLKWANVKGSVLRIFQVSIVVIAILVIFMSTPRVQALGWNAHRFVSGGAEDVFSDGSFFSNHYLTLHDWCIKPDQGWGEDDWHWLDAISYNPLQYTGGKLPWAVENVFDNIVWNLEDENWNTAAQLMGAICHYACDATCPLHSTENFGPKNQYGQNMHSPYESTVNYHLGEMSIPDYVPHELDNICEAALATLAESFTYTREGANPGDNNLTDFLENNITWNDWIKSMTENRLRAGVQFTANIWYTAMIQAELTIQAPTLIGPEDGEDTIRTPTLTWDLVEGTDAYDLQLATDNGFTSNVITIKDLTATSYIPKDPLAYGVWYWRVRSGDNSTNVGLWSGARHFTVSMADFIPPRAPIYINGNAGFILANGVTSGSGTGNDPYIIENWRISAKNNYGIRIYNTTAYFIIRNCYIYDGWTNYNRGIYLYNVRNGKIDNNIAENNYYGTQLDYSENNLISNNVVRNNGYHGIYLYYSNNNIVPNNLVKNNHANSIYLYYSDSNLVSSNLVNICQWEGIQLYYSDNNTIEKNLVKNSCDVGIGLFYSGNNLISNNFVANTNQYSGIYIHESSNNIICKNLVGSNSGGIEFWNSNNNCVYHNNIVNNTWQAYDRGSNLWDDGYPSGGNCWSDYTGSDANGDGIGDTPYHIQGGANVDSYPLMGNTPPGENVQVNLIPDVSVTFSTVIARGITFATTSTTGPSPPTGCSRLDIIGVAGQPIYYDITTIATYSGAITICIGYDETQVAGPEEGLRLLHEVNNLWEDITTSVDTVNNKIYGTTTTLSIFIVVEDVTPVRAKDTAYNVQNTGDEPWVWYAQGDRPPIMATKRVGAGAVVAAGTASTCRNGRWISGEWDVLLDKAFQWMKPGATKVLWYKGYNVYNDETQCLDLITALGGKGYIVASDGTQPITSSLLAPYDILVIPQLQLGDGNIGGDPSLLPDADVQAIKSFVEGGGGLFIMEGCDYAGGNYCKVQNKILRALNMGVYFQSDELIDDSNYWGDGPWFPVADVDPGSEIGAAYQTATGKTDIKLFSICSLLHISTINPHSPIYIDGNEDFTIASGVTSGSGTEDDPYIIEKWTISAESANGIEVRNTTAHFIIRNCYVYDGGSNSCGISFQNVTNGVVDNTLLENNSSGFLLIDSNNNIIKNCTAAKNREGIYLYNSSNDILRNNILSNNMYNFHVWGWDISRFYHDVDTSNEVNGKPIYYIVEERDLTFDGNATSIGCFVLVSCENIRVMNLDMHNETTLFVNTSYSTIENCTAENTGYGIELAYSSNNNIIKNCTAKGNSAIGIILYYSDNNTVENCTAVNNETGIWIGYSSKNVINNNIAENNTDYGIYLDSSSNNTISNSIAGNNDNCGIDLYSSNNNLIENNTTGNNNYGIYFAYSNNNLIENNTTGNNNYGIYFAYSNNNLIENNLSNNNQSHGIHLSDSDNNTISSNISSNNSTNDVQLSNSNNNLVFNNTCENAWDGICLETSYNNRIYHNNFVNNAWEQALDYGVNYWDNGYPSGGNYWSDYAGGDYCRGESQDIPVGDGIGDTPYSITGDNNRDRYPLMSPWPLWTGTVMIKRENLYAVTIDLNCDFSAGETLIVRFYTYGGREYQDQTIICSENIPGHVTLLENVSSPGKDAIQRLELVVVDSGGNMLGTIKVFETSRPVLVIRMGQINGQWPFANEATRTIYVTELGSINGLWPFSPDA